MTENIQVFDPRKHMNRPDFEVFHYRGSVPEEKEVHHHDFYEIFFLLGGRVTYWAEGQTLRLKAGDMLLMNPMVLHRPIPEEGEKGVYDRFVLWINRSYLEKISASGADLCRCFDRPMLKNTSLLQPSSSQRVALVKLLEEMVRESYSSAFGSRIYAEGVLRQFMVELNRMENDAVLDKERIRQSSSLVAEVVDYIGKHYSEELTLEGIAAKFYVSKYHLSHEFSREMGTGLYKYITLKRLMEARQLLLEGQPAGQVAHKCGFKDYTAFYRAFKAEYSMSPAQIG